MKRDFLLKLIAALAMLALPLPMMFLFETAAFEGFSLLRYPVYYAAAVIVCFIGFLVMKLHMKAHTKKELALSKTAIFLVALILEALAITAIVCLNGVVAEYGGMRLCFALLPAALIWYVLGLKLAKDSFSDIFTLPWLAVYIVETVLCSLAGWIMSADYDYMSFTFKACSYLLVAMSLITVLLVNQSNIQSQIAKRRNTSLIVPKGLRAYNAGLILIVGGIILAFLTLKDYIAAVIMWFVRITLKLIDMILSGLSYFKTGEITSTEQPVVPGGSLEESSSGHDIWLYLLFILLIVLIIVFRKKIIGFFRKLASRIFGRISADNLNVKNEDGFTDRYEHITVTSEKIRKEGRADTLKSYRKEKDTVKKYRLGYKLYMMWLAKRSRENLENMTATQHAKQAEKLYHGNTDTNRLAQAYTAVRYGDKPPTDDGIRDMQALIDELYR